MATSLPLPLALILSLRSVFLYFSLDLETWSFGSPDYYHDGDGGDSRTLPMIAEGTRSEPGNKNVILKTY